MFPTDESQTEMRVVRTQQLEGADSGVILRRLTFDGHQRALNFSATTCDHYYHKQFFLFVLRGRIPERCWFGGNIEKERKKESANLKTLMGKY